MENFLKNLFGRALTALAFVSVFLLVSCDRKSDEPLLLSADHVSADVGMTAQIEVLSGSGRYSATVDNPSIASATVDGNMVVVTAEAEGVTSMSVTDAETNASAAVSIEVTFDPFITFHSEYGGDLTLTIDAEEKYRDRVWVDLDGDGQMQDQEKVTAFGEPVKYPFSPDVTIYGPVTSLDCSVLQITELDITHDPYLTDLNCFANRIASLDLGNSPRMQNLNVSSNGLAELDLSECSDLRTLVCNEAEFTSLDLSSNHELVEFACIMSSLKTIEFGNISRLQRLNAWNNEFEEIDLSHFKDLVFLNVAGNKLHSVDVSSNVLLEEFSVSNNPLTSAPDLSSNTALTSILAYSCNLSDADFLKNVPEPGKVTRIMLNDNPLETINLSGFSALTEIHCEQCKITGEGMQSLISSLPDRTGQDPAKIYVVDRGPFAPHDEGNSATVDQIGQLKAKNWTAWDVYSGAGAMPYEGI